jgi:hypothetical protein
MIAIWRLVTWPLRFMLGCFIGLLGVTTGIPINHVRLTMRASIIQYGKGKAWLLVIASVVGLLAGLIAIGAIANWFTRI